MERAWPFDVRLRDQGAILASQRTLLRQLELRFGKVPCAISAAVESTWDMPQLEAWLDAVVTATTLDEVGIDPAIGQRMVDAEVYMRQCMLMILIKKRFGKLPRKVAAAINGMKNADLLAEWMERVEQNSSKAIALACPDLETERRRGPPPGGVATAKGNRAKRSVRRSRPTPARKPKK